MRRCGMAAALVGLAAAHVAYALVSLVICITFAVPLGLLLLLDALVGERVPEPTTAAPPAPPQQPVAATSAPRLAA
jgi:hypothetical protein